MERTAVSRFRRVLAAAALCAGVAAAALAGEVVVLKGGEVIALKQPAVKRGNTAYLTRADGSLLSVPLSEIDRDATAAANRAVVPAPAPVEAPQASTPAEAVRTTKDGPKARVRITDADVSHPLDATPAGSTDKKDEPQTSGSAAKVELLDYQQDRTGDTLVVRGTLRNSGQQTAESVRLAVTVLDEKGQAIDGTTANLSKGSIESAMTVAFTAALKVGDRNTGSLQFQPTWTQPRPPAPAARPAGSGGPGSAGQAAAASAANKSPAPAPTPFGRGTLYAAPIPNAPSEAPKDGKTGYIPGATSPDNQPKPFPDQPQPPQPPQQ